MEHRVRIVTCGYQITSPNFELNDDCYNEMDCSPISVVPTFRIFGVTSKGKKALVHLHGTYPYVFIREPKFSMLVKEEDLLNHSILSQLILAQKQLMFLLNEKLSEVLRVYQGKFIRRIERCERMSIYGFHSYAEYYWKIQFYHPVLQKKISHLLTNGDIINLKCQTFEAHIPYHLQVFIDNQLYGMNYIRFPSDIQPLAPQHKSSRCECEFHVHVSQLFNKDMTSDSTANPGIDLLWKDEMKRREKYGIEQEVKLIEEKYEDRDIDPKHFSDGHQQQILEDKFNDYFNSSQFFEEEEEEITFIGKTNEVKENESDEDDEELMDIFLHDMTFACADVTMMNEGEESTNEKHELVSNMSVASRLSSKSSNSQLEEWNENKQSKWLRRGEDVDSLLYSVIENEDDLNDSNCNEMNETINELKGINDKIKDSTLLIGSSTPIKRKFIDDNDLDIVQLDGMDGDEYLEANSVGNIEEFEEESDNLREIKYLPNNQQHDSFFCSNEEDQTKRVRYRSNQTDNVEVKEKMTKKQFFIEMEKKLNIESNSNKIRDMEDVVSSSFHTKETNTKEIHPNMDTFVNESVYNYGDSLNYTRSMIDLTSDEDDENEMELSHACQYLTIASLELLTEISPKSLVPSPRKHSIEIAVLSIWNESVREEDDTTTTIFFYVDNKLNFIESKDINQFVSCEDEWNLIAKLVEYIQQCDPDFFIGYDILKFSWGYLIDRINLCSDMDANNLLSRMKNDHCERKYETLQEIEITGRICLNMWRILRHEVTLNIYSKENVTYHLLHERIPTFTYRQLDDWWKTKDQSYQTFIISYMNYISKLNIRLLQQTNFIKKTSELARVFGIEFFHVLSRGSQYRVESLFGRIMRQQSLSKETKKMKKEKVCYIAASPTIQQRIHMRAPECIPLTMEPKTDIYTDPISILDFQSLYPSIIIAYNICYSTCIGHLNEIYRCLNEETKRKKMVIKFGCIVKEIDMDFLSKLDWSEDVFIAPSNVAFVRPHIRRGIIPLMLEDILDCRKMTKESIKLYKQFQNDSNKKKISSLIRRLDSQQLALKLLANVTYGYTSANMSGRMPSVEISDTIIQLARRTLEYSIIHINENSEKIYPKVDVVYGDTDSVFVRFFNLSKTKSFEWSHIIKDNITKVNPFPIKLKFEKIYQPSTLMVKKRYFGYAYETLEQKQPIFDAKGVETVRRDGCRFVQVVFEKIVQKLFTEKDLTKVREELENCVYRLLFGKVSETKLLIAKEYRGRSGYKPKAIVASLKVANDLSLIDHRAEPLAGERVPYMVRDGYGNERLIDLVISPDLLLKEHIQINHLYYINKQLVPTMNRILSILHYDVNKWVQPILQQIQQFEFYKNSLSSTGRQTNGQKINNFLISRQCLVCYQVIKQSTLDKQKTRTFFCNRCQLNQMLCEGTLCGRIKRNEIISHNIQMK
ncbi:hypothetical protein SNEBB_002800, partial [Seison nebaliae]